MRPGFAARRCAQLALTANALRPSRAPLGAIPSFAAGWPVAELAPHLLGLTVADTALHLARKGAHTRGDRVGIAASALSVAGLTALMTSARDARDTVESALTAGLGTNYRAELAQQPQQRDETIPFSKLALPFRMRDPEVKRERNIAYAPGGKRFLLDVYRPRAGGSGMPVLLQVHGGGWVIGNKDQQGIPLMLNMARKGWICVAINYPLSPAAHWPEHIVAVKRALAWLKDNIHAYGGDPAHIAVTGGSAGGHLAALTALTANDPRLQPGFTETDTTVQACVPHYGVYDFAATSGSRASTVRLRHVLARYVVGKDPEEFRDEYVAASPLERITENAPPFFVLHGAHDSLVPVAEARRFVESLRGRSGNPVAYAEIPGAQHAFDLFPSIRSVHVVRGVERFLEYTRSDTTQPVPHN